MLFLPYLARNVAPSIAIENVPTCFACHGRGAAVRSLDPGYRALSSIRTVSEGISEKVQCLWRSNVGTLFGERLEHLDLGVLIGNVLGIRWPLGVLLPSFPERSKASGRSFASSAAETLIRT